MAYSMYGLCQFRSQEYLQDKAANAAQLAALSCPFLVCQFFSFLMTNIAKVKIVYMVGLVHGIGLKFFVNPKRPGLFGQLDTRGGLILPFLRKRSLTPPNFIFEQQTESHVKAEVLS